MRTHGAEDGGVDESEEGYEGDASEEGGEFEAMQSLRRWLIFGCAWFDFHRV